MKKSELKQLIREEISKILNEADETSEGQFELAYPGTYIANWTVSDAPSDKNTVAKRFDFTIKIEHEGSMLVGTTIKDSLTEDIIFLS